MKSNQPAINLQHNRDRSHESELLRISKLLIDIPELAHLTSLSIRTLRRMDAADEIPGRVRVGRRVLFKMAIIREWVNAGLPDAKEWEQNGRKSR